MPLSFQQWPLIHCPVIGLLLSLASIVLWKKSISKMKAEKMAFS
jgi:hypothetical protein